MHLKRQKTAVNLPIPRKGTKYVARARSHINNSIPVVIALRDMLKLARTEKEVKKMIYQNLIKLNGRIVKDTRESVRLFNILEADKQYLLTLLPTGKFAFHEAKDKNNRLCKVIGKHLIKGKKIQINLHDGTNIVTNENLSVGDSIYLDFNGKIKKKEQLGKGKEAFVFSGKYLGLKGKIELIEGNHLNIHFKDLQKSTQLNKNQIIVL